MADASPAAILELTAQIVSAHAANAKLSTDALPALIHEVYQALSGVGARPPAQPERPEPAVPIKRSVFPDHIICLEDGKSFKTLRRHLQTVYGMTPDQYRQRWELPRDYPMVASDYAEHRSRLAKSLGLGRKGTHTPSRPREAVEDAAPKRRGRKPGQPASE